CSKSDSIAICFDHGEWKWAMGRRITAEVKKLISVTSRSFQPKGDRKDQIVWRDKARTTYTTKAAMKIISESKQKVKMEQISMEKWECPKTFFYSMTTMQEKIEHQISIEGMRNDPRRCTM
ncbi:hypothetical protein ACH5RR_022390, partial [Cinchona calisaya]